MENKSMLSFGELIKNYRKEKGITQGELGEILDRHQGTISNYEKGVHFPNNPEEIKAIAALLNQPAPYIIDSIEYARSGIIEQHAALLIDLDKLSEDDLESKYKFLFEGIKVTSEELGKMLHFLRFERYIGKQGLKDE